MKISELILRGRNTVSFEVFPPKRQNAANAADEAAALERTKGVVGEIAAERPAYISVTYGAAGGTTGANTASVSEFVQTCGVPALAHLTCVTSTRERVADAVRAFRACGIENVLCLRGDFPPGADASGPRDFAHAIDLVEAVRPASFCLGAACYPEGHPECAHLRDDIDHLKAKVDAGIDFLTSQMFFDNAVFYSYLAKIRSAGINIPVVPGIMPVTNAKQIVRICQLSGTTLAPRFRMIVDRFGEDPEAMLHAGIAYATEQIVDLFANGMPNVHVYTMNKPEIARRIVANLGSILARD